MRKDLSERLKPITENFIDELLKVHSDIENKRKDLEKEIEDAIKEKNNLKVQRIEDSKALVFAKDKMDKEIFTQAGLNEQIKNEIIKYNRINGEANKNLEDTKRTLEGAEAERKLTVEKRKKQEETARDYETKIDSLKSDFDRLQKNTSILNEKINKNNEREKILLRREEVLIGREQEIAERELDVKLKEKRLKFEIKRNEANA